MKNITVTREALINYLQREMDKLKSLEADFGNKFDSEKNVQAFLKDASIEEEE